MKKTVYQYDDDHVTVTAVPAKPSAMPDGAELCVTPIKENKDAARYLAIKNSVTGSLEATRQSMTGLLAYDISFIANGKKIEPGSTRVTIHFKKGVFGGGAEKIHVLHLQATDEGVQAEDVTAALKSDAVRSDSQTGTGTFLIDGSCAFAVAGAKAMPKAATSLSEENIRNSLIPVLPYAVFADSFTLTGDMEGCIAVNKASIGSDFGNSENNFTKNCTDANTVTVVKTYTGTKQRTFQFGLYGGDGNLKGTKNVTLQAGEKSRGSVTFPPVNGIDANGCTVKELNASGNPLKTGDVVDGVTLEKADSQGTTTGAGYSGINCTSYIQSFLSISGSHQLKSFDPASKYPPNILVVGSDCTVSGSGVHFGNGTINCSSLKNVKQILQGQIFPINFTNVLNDMENLSVQLAQMDTNDSGPVIVKNFTPSQLTQSNSNITTNGKLLVINIDATDYPKQFDVPAEFKLMVNGESRGGWAKAAPNIVVNVYARDGSGKPVPYRGAITDAGLLMGTLLAPRADITSLGGNYNGTIVAESVTVTDGELHSANGGYYGSNVIWNFENVECPVKVILPQTGGPGTAVFAASGIGLLLLSAALADFLRRSVLRKAIIGKFFSCGSSPPGIPRHNSTRTEGETQNTS